MAAFHFCLFGWILFIVYSIKELDLVALLFGKFIFDYIVRLA